ncbi:PREDICTED: putative receptor-like protein kinase At3g47110 [Ipomoea nil]|uniref:putative receptor-like protein kinase At3g47110 n=1 Tax=Ipomoea nil TaxID=35883 RepID=UPI000900D7FE|nr:PREDICTED: putative receptor-like protein kinase At3g47110 [Ipomoea nil]
MTSKFSLSFPFFFFFFFFFLSPVSAQRLSSIDLAALRDIKNCLTEIPAAEFFTTWDFASPAVDPCVSFAGVTCSGSPRRVVTLMLGSGLSESPRLAGTLSPSIGNLSELTQLVLFSGIVTGPIPEQLGSLTNLRVLSLTNNRLTGSIPAAIFGLPNLHTLDLSRNELTGPVPGVTRLTELRVMILAGNQLSGEFPAELPGGLLHLDLSENELSGELPYHLPPSLRYLSVSVNQMWGPLNGLESSSLSELVYLDLSMNRFGGPIPPNLFRTSLASVFLQRNNFSGGVHTQPQSPLPYAAGSVLDLSHNSLTGEIPAALAGAESVFLNNNRFVGTVPPEYFRSVYGGVTKTLYLQHNFITGFPAVEERGSPIPLPDSVTLCLSYNCAVPQLPAGSMTCPASAGEQLSRPPSQCSLFNNASHAG